jgi:hypothetical protein
MTHFNPNIALTVAVATPCCPAPVLSDDPSLAHAPGEQDLSDGVVDFVRPSVQEILSFEIDPGASQLAGQALG